MLGANFNIASAGTVTVTAEAGTLLNATDISSTTVGDDMAGMLVTAYLSDGSSQEITWVDDSPLNSEGIAEGNNWSLSLTGNSLFQPWSLFFNNSGGSDVSLMRLDINALAGGSVFDRTTDAAQGIGDTPGSGTGKDFILTDFTGNDVNILATYINAVSIDNSPVMYDIYGNLNIVFTDTLDSNAGFSGNLEFTADTDSVSAVPIPAAVWLFGSGLMGLIGLTRKKASFFIIKRSQIEPNIRLQT